MKIIELYDVFARFGNEIILIVSDVTLERAKQMEKRYSNIIIEKSKANGGLKK